MLGQKLGYDTCLRVAKDGKKCNNGLHTYSIKSVEKGQMYELYNHLLHYFGRALQQDKDKSSACRNVPSYKEWICN